MITAEQLVLAAREHVDELGSSGQDVAQHLLSQGIDAFALLQLGEALFQAGVIRTNEKVSRADNVKAGFIAGWLVGWHAHRRLGAAAEEFTA